MESHRPALSPSLLTAALAAMLLQACPQTLDDKFAAVEALSSGNGGEAASESGGAAAMVVGGNGTGGSPDSGVGGIAAGASVGGSDGATGGAGGDAGTAGDSEPTGGTANGSGSGATSGTSGVAGSSGASGNGATGSTGGSAGLGGGTGGTSGTGGTGGNGALGGTSGSGGEGATGGTSGEGGTGGSGGEQVLCASAPADCTALRHALIHRYSFNGTGTDALDSIGGADGTLEAGASLSGDGSVALDGSYNEAYVDLPNGLISGLVSVTLEIWAVWAGGDAWQRLFDFGDALRYCSPVGQPSPEGQRGDCGATSLMLTPSSDGPLYAVVASLTTDGGSYQDSAIEVRSSSLPAANTEHHYAVVVDASAQTLSLYVDGILEDSATLLGHTLSEVHDINAWLGRSQSFDDPGLDADVLEFRIYSAALTQSQLQTSFTEGPDPAFLE